MSKCNKCKYEYSSKLDEPCKYCRERMGEVSLAYQLHADKFQPKEEQSVVEHGRCSRCKYEHDSSIDEPCVNCSKSTNHFEPKEHDGCIGCVYEDFEELEEPCVNCKGTYKHDTMAYLKANDYFEPKEEKVDEKDMVNHPQHYSSHGIEPIDYIESHELNFNLGNVIKYVSRAKYKGTELQDLEKAKWYLEREISKYDR